MIQQCCRHDGVPVARATLTGSEPARRLRRAATRAATDDQFGDQPESFVRARVIYCHQIGYYTLAIDEDIERRLELAPYYYRVLTGKTPTPAAPREMTASHAAASTAAQTPQRRFTGPK